MKKVNKIEFIDVQKHYTDNDVVSEVFSGLSFKIDKNGFYGLKGVSGSGKSTLLKILNNDIEIDQGIIYLNGLNITSQSIEEFKKTKNENIHYMTSKNIFDLNKSVKENICFLLELKNIEFNDSFFNSSIEYFDIPNKKIKYLSSGETQRALFLFSAMCSKNILLVDEPTATSDIENASKMLSYLKKISKNMIVIMATNKEYEIDQYCDYYMNIIDNKIEIVKNKNISEDNKTIDPFVNKDSITSTNNKLVSKVKFQFKKYLMAFLATFLIFFSILFVVSYFANPKVRIVDDSVIYVKSGNVDTYIEKLMDNKTVKSHIRYYKDFNKTSIVTKDALKELNEYFVYSFKDIKAKDLFIDGRVPENEKEIVLPISTKYKIRDKITFEGIEDVEVVGITKLNYVFINEDMREKIAFKNFIIHNNLNMMGISVTNSRNLSVDFNLEGFSLVANVKEDAILDLNDKRVFFYDAEYTNIDVKVQIIDENETDSYVISKEVYNMVFKDLNKDIKILLLNGYGSFKDLKKLLVDEDLIFYNYLISDEMIINTLSEKRVQELILMLIVAFSFTVLVFIMQRVIFYKTSFDKYVSDFLYRKEKVIINAFERMFSCIISIVILEIALSIFLMNDNIFSFIKYSKINTIYYILPIIVLLTINIFEFRRETNESNN